MVRALADFDIEIGKLRMKNHSAKWVVLGGCQLCFAFCGCFAVVCLFARALS